MFLLRILLLASCCCLILSYICGPQEQQVYMKRVRCLNVSEKYVYPNYTCYAKSFNRTCSTSTVMGWFKVPMKKIYAEYILLFKYGTIYREALRGPKLEVCSLLKTGFTHPLYKVIYNVVTDSIHGASPEEIFHQCPYTEIVVKNAQIRTKSVPNFFSTGDYKAMINLYDEDSELVVQIEGYASNNSPYKETFG